MVGEGGVVAAVAGNVGQADELEGLEAKAIATGASKLIVADLVDEMVDEVIIPALKMDAKYETYLLGTAFARPVIGKKLAEIALAEGADAIAHWTLPNFTMYSSNSRGVAPSYIFFVTLGRTTLETDVAQVSYMLNICMEKE